MSCLGTQAGHRTRLWEYVRGHRLYDELVMIWHYGMGLVMGSIGKGNKAMGRWSTAKEGWRLLVAGCLLLAGTAGCGSSVSDKPANAELRAGNGKPDDHTGREQPRAEKSRQVDPTPTKVAGSAGATPSLTEISTTAALRDADDRLNIPDAVAKDLGSSDARDRYRALDYWENKDSKAPMDPVFDALADEDPAVRDKAAAIIDKLAEVGEERE
ncbi:MAG: hypothetical protein U0223_01210 [Nitrospira sp.]|nr:hypothetical protein [Nitrospira sp.]